MSVATISANDRVQRISLGIAGVLLAAVLWQLLAFVTANPVVIPAPAAVLETLVQLGVDPEMRSHVLDTLGRIGLGFAIGTVGGVAIGASIGSFTWVRRVLNPYLNFLRTVAPIAWIVPATIWLGVGSPSIVFVVVYAAIFPVALNTISGIATVDEDKLRMAKAVGLSPVGTFTKILIPNAVPFVLVGARLGLGLSFMAGIGAEMIIGSSGIGFVIFEARIFSDTAVMFAGILILGILGYVLDYLFVALRTSVFRKYYAGRELE